MASQRVTKAQRELLVEIAGGHGLFIRRYGRYDRTATALLDRGLVKVDEPDYSNNGQDHYVVTDAGREVVKNGKGA